MSDLLASIFPELKGIMTINRVFPDDKEQREIAIKTMKHVMNCDECKKLVKEFEKKITESVNQHLTKRGIM